MPPMVRRLWLVLCGAVAIGCLSSPTLPLPPPSPEDPTIPVDGYTRLQGTLPTAGNTVHVHALNERTNFSFGQITNSGTYDFLAAAESGDLITIWYTTGRRNSDAVVVEVPAPDPSDLGSAAPDAGQ